MHMLRSLVLMTAVALVGMTSAPAQADDCDCRSDARVHYNHSGVGHVRDRCHPSTRYVIPRHNRGVRGCGGSGSYVRQAYGPWAEMRRGLRSGRGQARCGHVRHYFLRRHPFALTKGAVIEEAAELGTLLAIGDADAGSERTLDAAGLLDRGTARFHIGQYDEARKDFTAILTKTPTEPRARLGLLMVAVVKNDWSAAARELDTLAKAGELRADDRFDTESMLADATKLKALTDGLVSTASYRMRQTKAHTVTAWLLAGQGDATGAKRFVRLAKRWGSPTPAVETLELNLGMRAAPAKAGPSAPAAAPATKAVPAPRGPNPALHREIAKVTRKGA